MFPLKVNGKFPLPGSKWVEEATTDPEQIRKWWVDERARIEHDFNIGVCTTGLTIVDIDTKNGKHGLESFEGLGMTMTSLTVRTASGGFHVYYEGAECANAAELLGKGSGLDVRGYHGYLRDRTRADGWPSKAEQPFKFS